MTLKLKLTCFILTLALLTTLSTTLLLTYLLKTYYTHFKLATLFPFHTTFYQTANQQLPPKTQKRIILFGDSRIQQWKNLPNLPTVEWINRGIGGETTPQLRARFQQDVLDLEPDIVILQMGINDLVVIGLSPQRTDAIRQQTQDNLRFIVETLQQHAITTLLLTIIPPTAPGLARLPVWHPNIPNTVTELNQHWLTLPPSPHLHILDTAQILQDPQGHWHPQVNTDTLHLTSKGYEYLNQAILPILTDRQGT